ncbi:MAG: tetratricopeptide repeat protein [Anaerolineae bacterium]|nr:tetratricopeptide repeat protein [Anaerolineae bacterium]MDH7474550.1 tetratricopeptide repeat protein [Anaerolineae bacterium]
MYPHPVLVILLIGLLYILGFGALSYLRRQGLSTRFAIEGLLITGVCMVFSYFVVPIYPILFLIILYLITMRVRLLADVGNWLTASKRYRQALGIYQLALGLGPDTSGRQIVLINRGVTQLYMQAPEAAIVSLEEALQTGENRLGLKYLAACHYNLGLAYRRIGREAEAVRHFNQAIDAWPMSVYAAHAEAALKKARRGDGGQNDEENG